MADTKKKTVKKKMKKPPQKTIQSIQMDMYSSFLANDKDEVSNTVELWERIPKYFLSPQEQTGLRPETGQPDPYEYSYALKVKDKKKPKDYIDVPYKVVLQPALIKQEDGSYKAFWPTKAEEIIEEVLKKIFTEQNLGIHDAGNTESWVKFSYSMINRELRKNGRGKTHKQIQHSLEILSKCVLTVYENNKRIYTNPILSDYIRVDREKYLESTDSLHVGRLSFFISLAINTLQYRQYNLKRLMACDEQLSQWLLKRLINRFIQASLLTHFDFSFSRIKAESGLLRAKIEGDNRKKVITALDELKETGAIYRYEVKKKKDKNKIIDVSYRVFPTQEFSTEQKAANARINLNEKKAAKSGLQIVDKSKPR